VPKIDWFADDADNLPRSEARPRRERLAREARERRARLEQIIAVASLPPATVERSTRQPLHQIWGAPIRRQPERSNGT
jgi:hypothetical protein